MKKCWAEKLGNCTDKISEEHIISKGLSTEELTISINGESVKIKLQDLSRHILCTKHNSDLSIFDEEIIKLKNNLLKASLQNKRFTQPGFGYRKNMTPINYKKVNGIFWKNGFAKL